MVKDLIKLILLIWMCATDYLMWKIYIDLDYMVSLVSAYIKMIVEYANH